MRQPGDDRSNMKDRVGPSRDRRCGRSLIGEIDSDGFTFVGEAVRQLRRHDVQQGEAIYARAPRP
jgi:hypothetical protein